MKRNRKVIMILLMVKQMKTSLIKWLMDHYMIHKFIPLLSVDKAVLFHDSFHYNASFTAFIDFSVMFQKTHSYGFRFWTAQNRTGYATVERVRLKCDKKVRSIAQGVNSSTLQNELGGRSKDKVIQIRVTQYVLRV